MLRPECLAQRLIQMLGLTCLDSLYLALYATPSIDNAFVRRPVTSP